MIKAIKINKEQSVTLNGAAGWFLIYREQFGHDILPDLMPMLEGVITAGISLLNNADGGKITVESFDNDVLMDFFMNISGLEATTILQIIWAMAKKADDDIAPPEIWFDQFETFPLDVVAPKVFRLILDSSVSSKNVKRLMNVLKTTAGSLSSKSLSEVLTED